MPWQHQNGDDDEPEEITIGKQLGPDPETGLFVTGIKSVIVMIGIIRHVCDMNTILCYVYGMISLNML